jgi:hypothetical protein
LILNKFGLKMAFNPVTGRLLGGGLQRGIFENARPLAGEFYNRYLIIPPSDEEEEEEEMPGLELINFNHLNLDFDGDEDIWIPRLPDLVINPAWEIKK